MKTLGVIYFLAVFVCPARLFAQVSPPKLRAEIATVGAQLWVPATAARIPLEVGKDPFHPPAKDLRWDPAPEEKPDATQRNPAEVVKLLAAKMQPTGSVALGGEPYLLFTERRQKIGDKLSVALDGVEYTVEIVSITSTRFRIRYDGQEAERTIK